MTRLTVKAPRGSRITVACAGQGCPIRRVAQTTAMWHVTQFQRDLRAGVKLTITVAKTGYITKVTTITIRRGKRAAAQRRVPRRRGGAPACGLLT